VSLVGSWPEKAVLDLRVEIGSIRRLMKNPDEKIFQFPLDFNRTAEIRYTGDERKALASAAAHVVNAGLGESDLLARGIVLHSDVAILGNGTGIVLRFSDGQGMRADPARADHWAMARMLGDDIDKKAGRNADLAFWYRASLSAMAAVEMWNPSHAERALERFPDDPELQFLVGCLHETLAAPRTQASVARTRLEPGTFIRVGSADDELGRAVSLLKRAVALNPRHTEARLHYGRVLTWSRRAALAVGELRRASSEATEPAQRYYAQLFLGAALGETNQAQAAREAYLSAAAIFPHAQAPRLAISELASVAGDRRDAAMAIEPLLALSANEEERQDPWWTYFTSYGRRGDELMTEANVRLTTIREGGTR
jgi:hypothetical protein